MNTIYRRLSDRLLTVHCPQCAAKAKHKVLVILTDKRVTCPSCEHSVDVDTVVLEQKIEAAQARRNAARLAPAQLNDAEIAGPLASL